jgi:hypothetical protein
MLLAWKQLLNTEVSSLDGCAQDCIQRTRHLRRRQSAQTTPPLTSAA